MVLNRNINRIVIIGGPGTGKTILANNLGRELNIPVYHLDRINHLENWQKRDAKERDEIILKIIDNSRWITDGTYKTTLEQRINKSDLVIFLDYSSFSRLRGIISRYFQLKGKEKPEISVCKEQLNLKFIKLAIQWKKIKRKAVEEILGKENNKTLLIFKNRRKLNRWYKRMFNKKIDVKAVYGNNKIGAEDRRLSSEKTYKSSETRSFHIQVEIQNSGENKKSKAGIQNNGENKKNRQETLENER